MYILFLCILANAFTLGDDQPTDQQALVQVSPTTTPLLPITPQMGVTLAKSQVAQKNPNYGKVKKDKKPKKVAVKMSKEERKLLYKQKEEEKKAKKAQADPYVLEDAHMCGSQYDPSQPKMDYIMFVQFWPGVSCTATNKCTIPKGSSYIAEGFHVHGFWPQLYTGNVLKCCEKKFDIKVVEQSMLADKELRNDMSMYWFSNGKCRFPMYEFDKHGTCAYSVYTGENGPLDYLKTVMDLRKRVDVWKILQDTYSYVPNQQYLLNETRDKIAKMYGAPPAFTCDENGAMGELRICYDINETNKFNPTPRACPQNILDAEKEHCKEKIFFAPFPEDFKNANSKKKNNCEY
ncbi:extracellular ribonuclease LE precursor, putative [Entamoeba invadens IP1]|uniref:extracellular ribonuclease LE precursor, putative n=1 Tax=Entamoeba invadens IP1 TaxID=370355 RepID=UPI0002C3EF4D|nr:extracellular ribonuclease LE precursor, putative [Entamoeba invadens IP1]ELP90705.1 extracellular ribonuclease LE precursor, putative [Entamoeba invadens IP1]|eukprot:XP_004257476.1 extracellular ribonuclease LE precursor, putative [Entamoeba invadens IP1]